MHVVTTMCWTLDGSTQNAGQVSSRVPGQTDPPTRGRLLDEPLRNPATVRHDPHAIPDQTAPCEIEPVMIKPSVTEDAALVRRLIKGDQGAARQVMDLYLNRLVAQAYRMIGDRAEAEDVAQETFLRLWRTLERWQPDKPLIHWLQRVTHNLCIDRIRKARPVSIDAIPEPDDGRPSALTLVHRSEIDDIVQAAILTLPDRQRSAILFVHQEGHTNIVTAEIMGISVEAVESLLARGRRRLRHALADLLPDLKGGTS